MKNTSKNNGFTLIELSIVLVIIGLIVGGVLVGRDLIKSAEIRKMGTTLQSYEVAINTFRGKYDNLPGDFAAASSVLPGANNGDGDGRIGMTETGLLAWQHLGFSGLIAGRYTGVPGPTFGSGGPYSIVNENVPAFTNDKLACMFHWFSSEDWGPGSYFYHPRQTVLYCGAGTATDWHYDRFIGGPEARALDNKMDDGKIGTGKIRSTVQLSTTAVDNPTAEYTNSTTAKSILLYLPGLY